MAKKNSTQQSISDSKQAKKQSVAELNQAVQSFLQSTFKTAQLHADIVDVAHSLAKKLHKHNYKVNNPQAISQVFENHADEVAKPAKTISKAAVTSPARAATTTSTVKGKPKAQTSGSSERKQISKKRTLETVGELPATSTAKAAPKNVKELTALMDKDKAATVNSTQNKIAAPKKSIKVTAAATKKK